jgi:hypothetical protein
MDRYGSLDPTQTVALSGAPYAYFSSYKTTNGYNRYFPINDCASLANPAANLPAPWPYKQGPSQFLNPNSYQIISAGADGAFGPGSNPVDTPPYWSPANASLYYQNGTPGRDDQANFYDSPLGISTQ